MSTYRIFPCKDTTIYSEYNKTNTGIDEILDLSQNPSILFPSYSAASRAIVQFDDNDIAQGIAFAGSSSYSMSFGLSLANATGIPLSYDLEFYAVSESWDMGTGRFDNVPATTDGASWLYRNAQHSMWQTGSYGAGVSASYYAGNAGGANWYTGSLTTMSFNNRSERDIYVDVTNIYKNYQAIFGNNGIIIKNQSSTEFNPAYNYTLMYFSVDTNTIYPPFLDIKWDDSVYNPNTGSMTLATDTATVITLGNNKGKYNPNAVERFNVNARQQFPQRTFVTSSLYTVGQYLPSSSYYSIKDLDTDNIVVDFDDNFTKISTDQNGSYFYIFMNGLEPERYYKFLIKTIIGGTTIIFDDNYYFKVERS